MSKSAIYVANTGNQVLDVDSQINPGSIVRRFGCNLDLTGNGIVISGTGYYDFDVSVTVTPTAAGVVTVTLYKDGVAIPGATASDYNTAGNPVNVSISTLIREFCCDSASVITFVLTGSASTVNNIAIVAEKV